MCHSRATVGVDLGRLSAPQSGFPNIKKSRISRTKGRRSISVCRIRIPVAVLPEPRASTGVLVFKGPLAVGFFVDFWASREL